MMFICTPSGLQFEGETVEQMHERDLRAEKHNRELKELLYRNGLPMKSMRAWAESHGLTFDK